MTRLPWQDDPAAELRSDPTDPRAPAGVVLSLGFAALLVLDGIGGETDLPATFWVVATVAAVALGSWWSRPVAALGLAGLAFLTLDGFVVGHFGVLVWHGSGDVLRLCLLMAVAAGVSWERNRVVEDERLDAVRRQLAAERNVVAHGRRPTG
jgi:hypothetical protein